MDWRYILNPAVLIFMVPVAAIVVGGIIGITRMWIQHSERMAMIRQGMHPDQPPPGGAGGKER